MKRNVLMKLAAAALALTMAVSVVPCTNVQAAKPSVTKKSITIPMGHIRKNSIWMVFGGSGKLYGQGEKAQIKVKNASGKITYSTSNSRVVTVNKDGWPTGTGAGTATVTVKNRGRRIGTVKVTVKSATCYNYNNKGYSIPKRTNTYVTWNDDMEPIRYANQDAKYSGVSSNSNIKIKNDGTNFKVYAKKSGTTKITVTETYKGKKRRLKGAIRVEACNPHIRTDGAANTSLGGHFETGDVLEYQNNYIKAEVIQGNGTVLKKNDYKMRFTGLSDLDKSSVFYVVGKGTAKIRFTDDTGANYGTYTVKVPKDSKVTTFKAADISFLSSSGKNRIELSVGSKNPADRVKPTDWLLDVGVESSVDYGGGSDFCLAKFTSSNTKVVKTEFVENYTNEKQNMVGYYGYIIKAVKPGAAYITASYGGKKCRFKVVVKK